MHDFPFLPTMAIIPIEISSISSDFLFLHSRKSMVSSVSTYLNAESSNFHINVQTPCFYFVTLLPENLLLCVCLLSLFRYVSFQTHAL